MSRWKDAAIVQFLAGVPVVCCKVAVAVKPWQAAKLETGLRISLNRTTPNRGQYGTIGAILIKVINFQNFRIF